MAKDDKQVDEDEDETSEDEAGEADEGAPLKGTAPLARVGSEADGESDELAEDGDEPAAAQLGVERYVMAGFFTAGLLGAFVLGKFIQAVWSSLANKDWFTQNLPLLSSVGEESRGTYCFLISGVIALVVALRMYKRPDVKTWSDEVAGELAKVVWPSKKEVYNSTFIVIVASAAATLYLALLDRLWAFVTSIVYGDGS